MPVFGLKMPDLRVNEQTGEVGHNLQKPASRDDSDAFDLSVVIADEPEVRSECPEGPPARKRLRVDHQSCKLPLLCNERFNLLREPLEIRFLK